MGGWVDMESRYKNIVLVDDDMVNLTMGYDALASDYDVVTVDSGARLFKILDRFVPDLILLDIEMPEMNGYDVIKILKENEETKNIPVIFLTAKSSGDNELKGLSMGAIDYITKPFAPQLLQKRVEVHLLIERQRKELEEQKTELEAQKVELIRFNNNLQEMVEEKTKTVIDLQNAVLHTVAELIESRDGVTGGHIGRTQEYLRVLLEAMMEDPFFRDQLEKWDTWLILQSAQLHDVGKIAIRDSILQKPGKLTEAEYETIKKHVMYGENIIDNIISQTKEHDFLEQARILVSTHHEKWDGSGYPKGLKSDEIPLQGRMMALVDVYDALVSYRPYKGPCSHEEVVGIISEAKGTQFDPDLVDVFLRINEKFKAISHNDGESGLPAAY